MAGGCQAIRCRENEKMKRPKKEAKRSDENAPIKDKEFGQYID